MTQDAEYNAFYSPTVSIYKFFKLFFGALKENKRKQNVIKSDIVGQLYNAKKTGKYEDLLEEFSFFDNGIFVYSKQVEDGISQMQLSGLISKKNPRFIDIIINDELDVDQIKRTDPKLFSKARDLVRRHVLQS